MTVAPSDRFGRTESVNAPRLTWIMFIVIPEPFRPSSDLSDIRDTLRMNKRYV